MIIIKIIILYFIQIRHTDDFPSTGTRLVIITITPNKLNIYSKPLVYHQLPHINHIFGNIPL